MARVQIANARRPEPGETDDPLAERLRVCQMRFASVHSSETQQAGDLREPAKVAIVNFRGPVPDDLPGRIATLLDKEWLVDELFGKPTVAIIVTGGAQAFKMLPRVERVFREGLVKAARATNAWVFTGGTSSGVMKYVGEALASHPDIPCIGMPLFGNVLGHELIEKKACSLDEMRDAKEQMVEYAPTEADNTLLGAALEPHHTHFLLLDNGEAGAKAWGMEIEFGLRTQLAYCAHDKNKDNRVPAVLLVVQGGPGTLKTVVKAVEKGVPVVVIADSGGCASAIRDFLTRAPGAREDIAAAERELAALASELDAAKSALSAATAKAETGAKSGGAREQALSERLAARIAVREAKKRVDRADAILLGLEQKLLKPAELTLGFGKASTVRQLRGIRANERLIELFELSQNATADISQSILSAVALDEKLPPHKMLELAIVWNNLQMIGSILAGGRGRALHGRLAAGGAGGDGGDGGEVARGAPEGGAQWDSARYSLQAALQLALELQAADVVAMLLSNGADVASVLLSRLYLLREKNRFRLFANMHTSALRDLRQWRRDERGLNRKATSSRKPGGWLGRLHAVASSVAPDKGASPGINFRARAAEAHRMFLRDRELLLTAGILTREQLHAIQDANRIFTRSARSFKPFLEEWLDADAHGLSFDDERRNKLPQLKPRLFFGGAAHLSAEQPSVARASAAGRQRALSAGGAGARGRALQAPGEGGKLAARLSAAASAGAESVHDMDVDPSAIPTTGCRIDDIFFWAVLMGDTQLADVLWRFSRTHLRLALLAADIYKTMMEESEQGRKHKNEIEPMRAYWETVATDVLEAVRPAATDHRTPFLVAKEILEYELSEPPASARGARGENVLALATRLQAKQFIAHRYCQLIMAKTWAGQLDGASALPLQLEDDTVPNWKIILKGWCPWTFVDDLLERSGLQLFAKIVPSSLAERADGAASADDADAGDDAVETASADGLGSGDAYGGADEAEAERHGISGLRHIYSIPAVKFWMRTTLTHGGVAFLKSALVLGTSITQPHGLSARPGPVQGCLEVLFALWVLGVTLDWAEARPAREAWARTGLRPAWTYVDSASLLFQGIVVCLRVGYVAAGEYDLAAAAARDAGSDASAAFAFGATPVAGYGRQDVGTAWFFPIFLAFSSLSCFFRFVIETLLVFPRLGVLAICTREMLANNLIQWGVMMVIVLFAFGLAFSALAPDYPLDPATRGCYLADLDDAWRQRQYGPDFRGEPACDQRFANGPWFISVWALFGDFSIDALELQRALLPALFLVALLIIAQVLLLNLLIAMMTDTYTDVNSRALIEWKYEHMLLVNYYANSAGPTPPPLNLVVAPVRAAYDFSKWVRAAGVGGDPAAEAEAEAMVEAARRSESLRAGAGRVPLGQESRDETRAYHTYLQQRDARETAEVGARVDSVSRSVQHLEFKQMEDREALDEHMKDLVKELGWLKQQVSKVPRASAVSRGQLHGLARSGRQRRKLHQLARSEANPEYVGKRAAVADWRVPWEVEWPSYEPVEFTHPVVASQPVWADPPDASEVDFESRRSFEQAIVCSPIGRPLNPRGRTGISGRGLLGKWGPNHAADPIVVRRKPIVPGAVSHETADIAGGVLFQMVAIQRRDTEQWAIPGGMVDDGELISETLRREFTEEAGALADLHDQADLEDALDEVFSDGREIYRGYVDDPRNTDNAWMETTVYLFYINEALAARLTLSGGSDALKARWLDIDAELLNSNHTLYADHRDFVERALQEREYLGLGVAPLSAPKPPAKRSAA